MKKLLAISLAAAAVITASAATFQENLEAGAYTNAYKQLNWSTNTTKYVTSVALATALYNEAVAATNMTAANIAANIAYRFGDKSLVQDLAARSVGQKYVTTKGSFYLLPIGPSTLAPLDGAETWYGKGSYVNAKGVEKFYNIGFNRLEPDMMFDLYKKQAAAGCYDEAAIIFAGICAIDGVDSDSRGFANWVDAERKEFIASTFTPAVVEKLSNPSTIYNALCYFHRLDIKNGDAAETISLAFCTPAAIKTLASGSVSNCPVKAKQAEFQQALVQYGVNPKMKIAGAKWLDRNAKNKNASKSIYEYVAANSSWGYTADFALYINDVDILLDTFMKIDTTATAKQVEAVLPIFNAIDAGYRTADLIAALKNINKKYTIKLYDDRATWEPILSKVRAMLDTL